MILNSDDVALMVLLDLSAAFDTIDHELLLERLMHDVGVKDCALAWLEPYLSDRSQRVHVTGTTSAPTDLSIGVPQGSVLGPLLFLVYILPLGKIIDRHGISRHGYADDTQLYCPITPKNPEEMKQQLMNMENCLDEVRAWMITNKLKLNDSKTELLVISKRPVLGDIQIRVGNAMVKPGQTACNLGATLDSSMLMAAQVNSVARSAYFHLRRISKVRDLLSVEACARAIHCTVTSRLDYHNGLLLGLPSALTRKLEIVQRNAARLLTRTPKRAHITPVLARLHWLPVQRRVEFKALSVLFNGIHSPSAPPYLQEMCVPYSPGRNLRSAQEHLLAVPRVRNSYGSRAFTFLCAKLWNSLPKPLREAKSIVSFKKLLKTHFYRLSYC